MAGRIAIAFTCVLAVACTRSRSDAGAAAADGGDTVAGKSGNRNGGKGGGAGALSHDSGKGGRGPVAGQPIGGAGSVTPVAGGYCCTPSKTPGCCMVYGGFTTSQEGCGDACDGMPVPGEAWKLGVDEHGCQVWIEPREWTDCCGCPPHSRSCDPTGTWKIEYSEFLSCGPLTETITLTSDEDGGSDEVVFQNRGAGQWQCGGDHQSNYEATSVTSQNGCVVTLSSRSTWCTSGEVHCEDLDLTLYLNPFNADGEVEGTFHACWCGNSGPAGTTRSVKGTATRMGGP